MARNRKNHLDYDPELKTKVTHGFKDADKLKEQLEKLEEEQAKFDSLVSRFDKIYQKQKKKLRKKNIRITDGPGNIMVLTAMLEMTLKLIPIAEKQFYRFKNDRAVYPVINLVKQAREIATDIQRLGGAASAAPVIINTMITPNFQHLLQSSLNEGSALLRKLKQELPREHHKTVQSAINEMVKNQTNYLGEINRAITSQIENYFDK
jgi:hypothetical protein